MAFKTSSKQKLSTSSAGFSTTIGVSTGGGTGPTITGVYITDSSYVNLDDTAVSTSGGYIKLIGTGFVTGCIAYVNGVAATTTFVSSTEVRAVVPALANGTYSLMVFNSAGSGAIWATGLTASGFPTVSTSTYSNAGNVLNIQLLASGDGTLTYSLQNGSTLPTGVTLSSSGVLSGTATAITSATVVSFTILVNDAQQQTSQQAITLSLTFGDDYFKSTVLAIQANTTPFLSDASTNNLVLTPNSTVKANEFNPYQGEGYYSGYFNGSSDYFSLTTSLNFALGTNAFTIEFWILPIVSYGSIFETAGGVQVGYQSSTQFGIAQRGTAWKTVSQTAPSLNTWSHIAIVRSGTGTNQEFVYINGVLTATGTDAVDYGTITGTATIGNTSGGGSNYFSGYISNLRVIKGVALYTEAFPLPTQPLTTTEPAVTYVAPATVDYLVVAGGGGGGYFNGGAGGGAGGVVTGTDFAVAANTALTVTVGTGGAGSTGVNVYGGNGTASVFSTISTVGGGGGGSGDGTAYNGQLGGSGGGGATAGSTVGTGGAGTAGQGYAGGAGSTDGSYRAGGGGGGAGGAGTASTSATGGGAGGIGISSSITGTATYYGGGGGGGGYTSPRMGGVGGLGGGGKGSISGPAGNGIANTGGGGGGIFNSGGATAGGAGGSGVVIIRYADTASPAVTTGNPEITVSGGYRIYRFTQSGTIKFRNTSSPAVTAAQTSLLTCQSNRFKDNSATASAITIAGSPKIAQAIPYVLPTNTYGSGYFNVGDYVSNTNAQLAFGTGDFTIEGWVYSTGSVTNNGIFQLAATTLPSSISGLGLAFFGTSNTWTWLYAGTQASFGTIPLANTWYHFAMSRSGTSLRLFLNGALLGTATDSTNYTQTALAVGAYYSAASGMAGYISDFRVVKGTAVYTAAFTPPTAPLTAVSGTSLLTLQTKSAHNNNTYQERSSYNNLLTPSGTPSQGTFSPFSPAGWSNYFTAATDYLTAAPTVMGATAFTVECWINTTNKTAYAGLCKNGAAADWTVSDIYVIGLDASGNSIWIYNATNSISLNGTTTVTDGKWHHIAFVYNGTNYKLYIDGVENATVTAAAMTQTARVHNIGCDIRNARPWVGSVSNFRMVNGTAVYTAAFTPPIAPLTAVSGTVILTCQDNRFKDNAKDILTVAGTPKVQAFSPFKPSAAYDPVIHGGSTYFNGTTDYLSTPINTSLGFGTGDFTVEYWFYQTSTVTAEYEVWEAQTTGAFSIYKAGTSGALMFKSYAGTDRTILTHANLPINTWIHIAVSRVSGTTKSFVNGVQTNSISDTTNYVTPTVVYTLGGRNLGSNYFPGYISNFRVIKGTGLYTGSFIPSTTPLPRTTSTVLLLDSTSAAIIDASGRNNMLTIGDTKISTAVEKYGVGSIYFDGTGDYLSIPQNTLAGDFGTGDFTVEFWMNATAAGTYVAVVGTQSIAGNTTAGMWRITNRSASANGIYFNYTTGSAFTDLTFSTTNYNDGAWHHVAACRASGTLRMFVDGVAVGTATTVSQSLTSGQKIYVGYNVHDSQYYTGYIDDLRITKGFARYTANFTPPTAIPVS